MFKSRHSVLFSSSSSQKRKPAFEPIPENEKIFYHFDLAQWFYRNEAARKSDLQKLRELKERIIILDDEVEKDPAKLLVAIELKQEMGVISDRLRAYGGLRYAVNTNDIAPKDEGELAVSEFEGATRFVSMAVQKFDPDTLLDFITREPKLEKYAFLFKEWRRHKPHTVHEATETLLAMLDPFLDPFKREFYTLMMARTPDATLSLDGQELNVMDDGDFPTLLRQSDRQIRELAFRKRLVGYSSQADLYAYALFHKVQLSNSIAKERQYGCAIESALFDYYLAPSTVEAVLKTFRDHASLAIRFQSAERNYQQKILQLEQAEPWDMEARPENIPEPRFVIGDASESVIEATKIFGAKYRAELTDLLDPRNGRMDIVAGDNRQAGDFTWGAYGPSWVFFMHGYTGYLKEVVTLAHEAAHAVHFSLLYKAGVPWHYGDGARYFTEGFAKVNELLILDQLAKTARDNTEQLFYSRELASKLASVKFASMYWAAYATSFESEVYRRVEAGTLKGPTDIHEVWAEFGRLWMLDFDKFPALKNTWAGTHHFFDNSRYYSNYLFAWVLAVSVYVQIRENASFAQNVTELMESGFTGEPSELLKKYLGIDLGDTKLLESVFGLAEERVAEFEGKIRSVLGKC